MLSVEAMDGRTAIPVEDEEVIVERRPVEPRETADPSPLGEGPEVTVVVTEEQLR